MKTRIAALLTAAALIVAPAAAAAADVVKAGGIAFVSGVYGHRGDALAQVDEVVAKADAELKAAKLGGIGAMMQHTIFLKDGAVSPLAVLDRFHHDARKLAPGLVAAPSVGTIIRVPSFPDPRTLVMVDMSAGGGKLDRVPFTFGPKEIAQTIGTDRLLFTAGIEGMDFEHGKVAPTIDEQIEAIVAKLDGAMRQAGLGLDHMVSHTLYVTKGTDPIHVIERFHALTHARAPGLVTHPSVGTLVLVDGMAVPNFLMEMDAVASRAAPASLARTPFHEMKMDIAKTVAAGGLVFVAGMEGIDFDHGNRVAADVGDQADASARKTARALKEAGLAPHDLVKLKLYVKQGEDPARAAARFHQALARLDPAFRPGAVAETVMMVEGLAGPTLKFEATAVAARR